MDRYSKKLFNYFMGGVAAFGILIGVATYVGIEYSEDNVRQRQEMNSTYVPSEKTHILDTSSNSNKDTLFNKDTIDNKLK